MPEIKISVKNKIATAEHGAKFVCGNSDYTIKFDFDEEWSGHNFKTALFVFKGQLVPVAFDGNECEAPIIRKATLLGIGVKTSDGELKTTTPAYIPCELSAEDISEEEIEEPTPSVYDEIIELINAGMVKGDKGDKGEKGDKGDAGAIKFVTVVSLPTENIQYDAIYLVPIENADGENRFTEYAYIDGNWETLGAISIQVDHSEYVKFTDIARKEKAGVVRIDNSFGVSTTHAGNQGFLSTVPASKNDIAGKTEVYCPITSSRIDYAWKMSATDNKEEWTDEEKASACETIGAMYKPAKDDGGYMIVPAISHLGAQTTIRISYSPLQYTLVPYQGGGRIKTNDPQDDLDCANKGYVDDLVGDIEAVLDSVIALQNSLIGGNV